MAPPVDDRLQNGRVCQKYVTLTEANAVRIRCSFTYVAGLYLARIARTPDAVAILARLEDSLKRLVQISGRGMA